MVTKTRHRMQKAQMAEFALATFRTKFLTTHEPRVGMNNFAVHLIFIWSVTTPIFVDSAENSFAHEARTVLTVAEMAAAGEETTTQSNASSAEAF